MPAAAVTARICSSMRTMLLLPALLAALSQSPDEPRRVVRAATAAVEGDSVEVVRARWQEAASVGSRAARLGLGTLAWVTYDYASARAQLEELLPAGAQPDDAVSVRARIALAQVARAEADFATAERMLIAAREGARRIGDEAAETEALLVLAMTRSRTQGPAAAEALFDEALPRTVADPHLGALHHCARADLLVLTNRPARDLAERGAALARRAGAGRLEAACVAARASDRAREGDVEGALADMLASAELRRRLHDHLGLAVSLQWRGYWLRSVGRLEQARIELEEAVAAARVAGANSPLAWSYANLAYIDLALGDAPRGSLHADSASTLFATQGDRYGAGTLQGVLADVSFGARELAAARAAYTQSLATLEPLGFGMGTLTAHVGLAHVAMTEGAWEEADRRLRLAAGVARAAGAEEQTFGLAYHRGVLALRQGRLAEAERELLDGLRRLEAGPTEELAGAQPDWTYHFLMRLAEIRSSVGDLEGALGSANEALDALEAWRSTLTRPELRVLAFQVSEDPSDPDLGFASIVAALVSAGRLEDAFALSERVRARSRADQLARIEALGAAGAGAGADGGAGLVAARASDVRAALPPRTALLSWVTGRGGEPTTLFIIDQEGARGHVLPPADSVEVAVRRLAAALAAGEAPAGLIATVSRHVLPGSPGWLPGGVEHLVLVPDGPLHRAPFDVLAETGAPPLIDRYTLTLQGSAGLAVQAWRSGAVEAPPSVLALGDPELPPSERGLLPPLPGARREARFAARYGMGSELFLGPDASEARLKALEPGRYGLLHFATHARVDEATLAGAALVLAAGEGEDGVLRAGELGSLRLDVPVVLLSSCSTADGRAIRGEGLVGLASALGEAGVRTVVLTRWDVDDRVQAELIEVLYERLAEGLTVAEAVRAAKVEMRARGASPAVWAALVVVGDGDVRVSLAPPSRPAWAYGAAVGLGGLLVLIGAATLRARRRSGSAPA